MTVTAPSSSLHLAILVSAEGVERWQLNFALSLPLALQADVTLIVGADARRCIPRRPAAGRRPGPRVAAPLALTRRVHVDRLVEALTLASGPVRVVRAGTDRAGYPPGEAPDLILRLRGASARPAAATWPQVPLWGLRVGEGGDHLPCAYLEVLRGARTIRVTLVEAKLGVFTELLVGVIGVMRHSYRGSLGRVAALTSGWPALAHTRHLLGARPQGATTTEIPAQPPSAVPARVPLLRLAPRTLPRAVAYMARSLLVRDRWTVGLVEAPIARFLESPPPHEVAWIPEIKGRFLADGFGVARGGEVVALMEDLDLRAQRGRISACHWTGALWTKPVKAIELPCHMAYPYLLTVGEDLYCIPDTGNDRCIRLFRANGSPFRWTLDSVLIEDVAAVDPTVIRVGRRWWLFCSPSREWSSSQLHAWFADELRGPWTPHPLNPITTDITSSRPAGTPFWHGGHLYRPAQDCSTRYGAAVSLQRVVTLSPSDFVEETAARVSAFPGRYHFGIHTLAAAGEVTIVDGVRDELDARGALRRAVRRVAGAPASTVARP